MGVLPCYLDKESTTSSENEMFDEFANRKELGHARIPPYCPPPELDKMVDRAVGLNSGLVDGDYIRSQVCRGTEERYIYSNVCLRGLTGMHLAELGPKRAREKTWKFCLYQAIVALLAKTQLRYKYAWSANIDYIYQHAWLLFVHVGYINVTKKQRFDDVLIYNYKYSIDIKLISETKSMRVIGDVAFDFKEEDFISQAEVPRKELTRMKKELGIEHTYYDDNCYIHKKTGKIERWFNSLVLHNKNCIFRTSRFCLAFWKDGMFWYIYNPFRCDKFGMWDDRGYACIMKFCSKKSMTRYLMILLLRAYVYKPSCTPGGKGRKQKNIVCFKDSAEMRKYKHMLEKMKAEADKLRDARFTIQIFEIKYHCGKIHNLKLFQKRGPKPKTQLIQKKHIDGCTVDPLSKKTSCELRKEKMPNDHIEKSEWLKTFKITWWRALKRSKCGKEVPPPTKPRWHQFFVEEPRRLFSLWGDMHVTDQVFTEGNRGKQVHACYVVCSGMTRITAPEYWTSKTLDTIVMCGDRYYTHSVLEAKVKSRRPENEEIECWRNYLTDNFKIGEMLFKVRVLPSICGRLFNPSTKYLWQSLEQLFLQYHFAILTCESTSVCVFKYCSSYYMYDANSIGAPLFNHGCGVSYLLRTTNFSKFVTVLILTIGSSECSQFALNPIDILKVIDIGSANTVSEKVYMGECKNAKALNILKSPCPYSDDKKKKRKNCGYPLSKKTIDQTACKTCT